MSHATRPAAPIDIRYCCDAPQSALGLVSFAHPCASASSLSIHTGLQTLSPPALWRLECFNATGPVRLQQDGLIRHASDDAHLLGVVELAEADYGGIEATAEAAYRLLQRFNAHSGYPHILRMWNYLDDINAGDGDQERYKRFCVGRARGFGVMDVERYPAASAIGRQQRNGILQVYWLAARGPGLPLENPRQISPYRYPRAYGPTAPGFARATLIPDGPLLISGTASIVGHASMHAEDLDTQLHETLNNIDALLQHAGTRAPRIATRLDSSSLLKIYLRHAGHAAEVEQIVRQRSGPAPQLLILAADICRRELLLEIDCVHGLPEADTRHFSARISASAD